MRYFIELSYKGTHYHGWQVQDNAHSVQAALNRALTLALRVPVETTGAGRTDTGVHARLFYAHFDLELPCTDPVLLVNKLNRILPKDISIAHIYEVHAGAHARFDAQLRTYKYFVSCTKNPFCQEFALNTSYCLDMDSMNQAAGQLLQVNDFTSFAKLHSDTSTNVCKVSHAQWLLEPDHMLVFTISADRFLRNMVRSIVGTLLDVGRGKISQEQFTQVIQDKSRSAASTSAPAHGLFLWDVKYPFITK